MLSICYNILMLKNIFILLSVAINLWLISGVRLGQCSFSVFKQQLKCSSQQYEMREVLEECTEALLVSPTKREFKDLTSKLQQCSVESIETYKQLNQCRKLLATVCDQHTF